MNDPLHVVYVWGSPPLYTLSSLLSTSYFSAFISFNVHLYYQRNIFPLEMLGWRREPINLKSIPNALIDRYTATEISVLCVDVGLYEYKPHRPNRPTWK